MYKYLFSTIISMFFILISIFIISLFGYYSRFINLLIIIISMIIGGFIVGYKTTKKVYLSGIILSFIFILFSIIYKLIIESKFNIYILIYYFIILFSATLSSCIGISLNKKEN